MVKAGDEAGDTIIMVEIDPREGSGVIPTDWSASSRSKDGLNGWSADALNHGSATCPH